VYRLTDKDGAVAFEMGRRPIFNATLRAAAGWLFFRVARSLRIKFRYARRPARNASRSDAGGARLEKQPTDLRRRHHYM